MLSSFIAFPWSIKIFYGIISDNLPIMGSKRKSYLVILSVLQFFTMQIMVFYTGTNYYFTAFLLMLNNLSIAAMDVIVDSIMVVQSRKDSEEGSE